MTLNVIVYQYGKVASTSLVTTLNKMRGVSAHQCHFFGEDAFQATITRLCNPDINDYFFKHSLGQLAENLKAYRLYHRKDPPEGDRCIILTVAREPFDWFRSSLLQEIEGHVPALALSLRDRGMESMRTEQIIFEGLSLLLERIRGAIESVEGGIDTLVPAKRRELDQMIPFTDNEDFEAFLFLLGRFLQPHWWFRSQFTPEFGIDLADMIDAGAGLLRGLTGKSNIYLARYEKLEAAFAQLLELENLPRRELVRVNEGHSKQYAAEISAVFDTEVAAEVKALSRSEITQTLGYD